MTQSSTSVNSHVQIWKVFMFRYCLRFHEKLLWRTDQSSRIKLLHSCNRRLFRLFPNTFLLPMRQEKENMKHKTQSKLTMNCFPSTIKEVSLLLVIGRSTSRPFFKLLEIMMYIWAKSHDYGWRDCTVAYCCVINT